MKKTFLVALLATTLFACSTPAETKVEATTRTTSVTTEGPDVELMKKAGESWASANWDAYLSCYADTAISVHNVWAVTTDTTVVRKVSSYIDTFLLVFFRPIQTDKFYHCQANFERSRNKLFDRNLNFQTLY